MMGDSTQRIMPPTWKSGIALQHTSVGLRSCPTARVVAPAMQSLSACGTIFFLPVVPEVSRMSTGSSGRHGVGGSLAARGAVSARSMRKRPAASGSGFASSTSSPSFLAAARQTSLGTVAPARRSTVVHLHCSSCWAISSCTDAMLIGTIVT